MILSLDVDGVLADEVEAWRGLQMVTAEMKTERERDLFYASCRNGLYFANMKPLIQPTHAESTQLVRVLQGWDVQIVTKREVSTEAVTITWVLHHYPWLEPFLKRIHCVGASGSKVDGVARPQLGIDDSMNVIREYRCHNVPVVAVKSPQTDVFKCRNLAVPVVDDVCEAIRVGVAAVGADA